MRKAKASQVQRIASLEKIMTQMYLKVEALKTIVDNIENGKKENKITG